MKKIISVFLSLFVLPAFAAPYGAPAQGRGRAGNSMANQMRAPQSVEVAQERAGVASKNQISAMATLTPDAAVVQKSSIKADADITDNINVDLAVNPEQMIAVEKKDMREKEKGACIANNIGIGNTFVWASRFSNLNSYSTMVEDVENPENNTCFVKVELKSNDSRIGVSDVPVKYYEWGQNITCGAWADYDVLKKRILDAKKSARTWATVGGAVGGAAVGVGAMELFGNRIIGGDVEGQKDLERKNPAALLRSQLAVSKKENEAEYKKFIGGLRVLKIECEKEYVKSAKEQDLKDMCEEFKEVFNLAA